MLCAVVVALWWSVAVSNSWPTEDCLSQRQATLQWTFTSCCCLRCFRHSLLNSNVHAVKLGHQCKTLPSRTVARLLMCRGTLVAYQMHYLPQSSSIVWRSGVYFAWLVIRLIVCLQCSDAWALEQWAIPSTSCCAIDQSYPTLCKLFRFDWCLLIIWRSTTNLSQRPAIPPVHYWLWSSRILEQALTRRTES